MTGWLMRWHRRIGIVACVGVLLWCISGLMHPIMSRLNPRPVQFMPPAQVLDLPHDSDHVALQMALRDASINELNGVRVVRWPDGAAYYQISLPQQAERRYLPTSTNAPVPSTQMDADYATLLARHYLGDQQAAIKASRIITEFDDEYVYINRLLPVWRIDFDRPDGMRVYVDTGTAKLGAMVDDRKAMLSQIFRWMHSHTYAEGHARLRLLFMSSLLGLILITAMGGLVIYGVRWGKMSRQQGLRIWHRRIGLLVSLALLMLAGSGAWHLLMDHTEATVVPAFHPVTVKAEQIRTCPLTVLHDTGFMASDMAMQVIDGQVWYRFAPQTQAAGPAASEHDHHASHEAKTSQAAPMALWVDVQTSQRWQANDAPDSIEATLVGKLAKTTLSEDTKDAKELNRQHIVRFGDGYGFIFKRLPVERVAFDTPDHQAVYVDPATGVIAAVLNDEARTQGWIFAYLHKWEWLVPIVGKDGRDFAQSIFALGNAVVALLGIWLFTRTRRPAVKRNS